MGYFLDWNRWLPIMKNYEAKKGSYFATPAVTLIKALNVRHVPPLLMYIIHTGITLISPCTSLKEMLAEGMEKRFQAHVEAAQKVRKVLASFGLGFIPIREELGAHTLSVVRLPSVCAPLLL